MLEVVVAMLLVYIGFKEYWHIKERKTYLNAIVSKNAQEMRDLEIVDKTKINLKPVKPQPSDLVPLEELSDEDHFKAVTGGK